MILTLISTKMIFNILWIVLGVALVLFGADKLTEGASALARRMNVPEIIIGLTIVAAGTSAPEFFVSLVSALNGTSDMAVGNVVGSNDERDAHRGSGSIGSPDGDQSVDGEEGHPLLRTGFHPARRTGFRRGSGTLRRHHPTVGLRRLHGLHADAGEDGNE